MKLKLCGKIPPIWNLPWNQTIRVMKLTIFLLTVGCLHLSAKSFSQRISINETNVSLSTVIKSLEKQSGYNFFYDNKLVKPAGRITVSLKNVTLEQALLEVLKGKSLSFSILDQTVILKHKEESAITPFFTTYDRVTGKVTDEKGLPMPGVSVKIKTNAGGTITDNDGKFQLTAKKGDILIFSYIGYVPKEVIYTGEMVNVSLSLENITMNEVVVTAYGKVKKSNLTDAVQTISGEILESRPIRTISDGLIGVAPGLNIRMPSGAPEVNPSINIRGFTSINSSSSPLILVDGVERPIQDINPNDVESISVLKDGASTAIYGSRAPYGVILIITKSGKVGKASINYSNNFKIGEMVLTPTQPNSPEWARYINIAQRNGQPNGTGSDGVDQVTIARMEAWLNKDWTNPAFDDIRKQFGDKAQLYIENGQFPSGNASFKGWTREQSFATTKLYDTYFNDTEFSQQQNLNFSGGTEKVRYFSSFGYNNTKGLLKGDLNYNRRYNFQTKLNYQAASWLDLRTDVSYVRQENQGPNYYTGGGSIANYDTIFASMMQYFATPLRVPSGNAYSWILGAAGILGEGGLIRNTRNDIVLNGGATIRPFKFFEINADYSRRQSYTQYSKTDKIAYTELPDGTKIQNNRSANVSSITKTNGVLQYQMAKLTAQYNRSFAGKHNLFAQFGVQTEETNYNSLTASRTDLYAPDVVEALNAAQTTNQAGNDSLYDWSTVGFYGVITYDYAEKYMLKVTGRRDASSRFSADSRWSFFPSVSGGWNAAKESFWPLKNLISDFKPRVSWSTSGDLASLGATSYYTYVSTLPISLNKTTLLGGTYSNVATAPGLLSTSLTWAKPTVLNIGIDVSAFKKRLNLSYEWYQRTIYDQIGPPYPLPQVLGTTAPNLNNAASETRGWEFSIGWNDQVQVAQKPLAYSLKFNMSDYIGYVTKYQDNPTGSVSTNWTVGEKFGQNYVYQAAGIAQNTSDLSKGTIGGTYNYPGYLMYKDLNGDGYIGATDYWYSRGDEIVDGFTYPRKSYSIMPSISWNNFSVSAIFEGVMQWRIYNSTEWVWGTRAGSDLAYFYTPAFKESTSLGYWSPDNKDAFFPAFNTGRGIATDKYSLNLANLRVRNVTIGYDIPKKWLDKIKLSRINIYASGENLGFIFNKSYIKYDPELLSNGVNGYPPLRYYSFGLNMNL